MKKIKSLFLMIFAIFGAVLGLTQVNAQTYSGQIKAGNWISGYYVMHSKGTSNMWLQAQFINRTSDGAWVYCVQPMVHLSTDATYEVTTEDIASVLSMSKSTWEEISKIAYYGYGYSDSGHDHSADKWYIATQMLIWKRADTSVDSYFTNTLKGTRNDSILSSEMNEIMDLVNNHTKKPNFNMPSQMTIGETITVTDTNGVLSSYDLSDVSGAKVSKNGNELTITATQVGNISFNLTKMGNRYGVATELYYATSAQNVMHRGNIDPIRLSTNIKVVGGKISISKTDEDTNTQVSQGEATLSGATYGVYKEDGTKVTTITTDSNGNATSDYLPSLGKFYLLEEKASNGYLLDKNKHYFEISTNDLNPTVQVFEKVITRTFDFTKVYADSKTGIMTPEPNVKFGVYNNKNELVKELTTDSQGNFKFTLPYGTYTVKQLTTTKDYEKAKDFTIEVKETGTDIKKVIANAEINARLKVVKIDADNGNVIKRSNIKFKIKNLNTGKYVSQTITYPKAQTIDTYETDDEGVLITPYPLTVGNYQLEEVDQAVEGYLWNKESKSFHIGEGEKYIEDDNYGVLFEVKFENHRVTGSVELEKTGEIVNIENGTFNYSVEFLKGVKFGLYASEDIYDGTGNLIYEKDELIDTKETDENGKLSFTNLYLGKYYVQEIETLDNYVLDENKYEFELKYKDQYTENINYDLNVENEYKKGTLEFTKTDLTTGKVIPNTKIEIYTENDELIYSGKTDEEGNITIKDLFIGKFYIVETKAATGYKLSDEKVYFEIKDNDEIVKANMTNEKKKGTLEFTKLDVSTSEPLPNTLIEIYNENDELIYSGRTNEEGNITIDNLEYGKYYILEKEAPDGYQLNEEKMYFEILEDGEIVKCTMTDEKVVIEVPNTEENTYIIPITLILMGAATGVVIYEEIKKRKNKKNK